MMKAISSLFAMFTEGDTTSNDALMTVKQQGYADCMDGKHENRYPKGTPEHDAWKAGETEGYQERMRYW